MRIGSYILCKFNDQIWKKKEHSDHCRVMVEKKQHWNLKYQKQNPVILHIYELNIVKAETG